MSIYSGFATRKTQENYNNQLSKLLFYCQQSLIYLISQILQFKNINQQQNFIQKTKSIVKILNKMNLFQQHKYLQPKFSKICLPLQKELVKFTHNYPNNALSQANIYKQNKQKNKKIKNNFNRTHKSLTSPNKPKYSIENNNKNNLKIKSQRNLHIISRSQKFETKNRQQNNSDKKILELLTIDNITPLNQIIGMKIYKSIQKSRQNNDNNAQKFLLKSPDYTKTFQTQITQTQKKKNLNQFKKGIYIRSPQFQSHTRSQIRKKSKTQILQNKYIKIDTVDNPICIRKNLNQKSLNNIIQN